MIYDHSLKNLHLLSRLADMNPMGLIFDLAMMTRQAKRGEKGLREISYNL